MKRFLLLASCLLYFVVFFISCSNNEHQHETDQHQAIVENDSIEEVVAMDTSDIKVYQEEVDETATNSLQDALKAENAEKEEVTRGLSFCDCVKKQKELSDLMMATEDDAVFDKAMSDLEAMKTGDCKILFAGKQNTIEAKRAHERKVKKCLNGR